MRRYDHTLGIIRKTVMHPFHLPSKILSLLHPPLIGTPTSCAINAPAFSCAKVGRQRTSQVPWTISVFISRQPSTDYPNLGIPPNNDANSLTLVSLRQALFNAQKKQKPRWLQHADELKKMSDEEFTRNFNYLYN